MRLWDYNKTKSQDQYWSDINDKGKTRGCFRTEYCFAPALSMPISDRPQHELNSKQHIELPILFWQMLNSWVLVLDGFNDWHDASHRPGFSMFCGPKRPAKLRLGMSSSSPLRAFRSWVGPERIHCTKPDEGWNWDGNCQDFNPNTFHLLLPIGLHQTYY